MRSAIDKYTRACVNAEFALPERPYICACCEAPVIVRAGSERAAHFAHRQGRARDDCEQYFPTSVTFTGRPARPIATEARDDQGLSYLCCVDSSDGLMLALWLPPAGAEDWSGSIRFESQDVTRSLRRVQLAQGITIPFPLKDGQWSISVHDEVDERYLARIDVGRRSLELERNLFHATSKDGRAISRVDSVQLGDTIWWIRKTELEINSKDLPHVEAVLDSHTHGWFVYLVTLPQVASPDELANISHWLQRRVRPRRPTVWINSPWPRAVLNDQTALFSVTDGALRWLSDRPVDLRIISPKTEEAPVNVTEMTEFTWEAPLLGDWEIWVNDVHTNSIRVLPRPPTSGSAVLVDLSPEQRFDIAELQRFIRAEMSAGSSAAPAMIRWRTSPIGKLIKICGRPQSADLVEMKLELRGGVSIDAGHFGYAEWPAIHDPPTTSSVRETRESRELANWLASVGSATQDDDCLKLHPSHWLQDQDPLYRRLAQLSWPRSLTAQVRQLAKELEGQNDSP